VLIGSEVAERGREKTFFFSLYIHRKFALKFRDKELAQWLLMSPGQKGKNENESKTKNTETEYKACWSEANENEKTRNQTID
jgi:hypothetical protein